ncbi:MAG: hypothetical protein R3261_10585, partial [Alphaproteobacteria bacterium]|nr:hypothetical protein [Alphaproteobacteria bacterium]
LHGNKEIFDYEISVARLAGKYATPPLKVDLILYPDKNQERLLKAMEHGNANFDLFFTGYSKDREERFLQIDIPLTRGLLGHRIFIIHKDTMPIMENINTLADATSRLSIGSGTGWPDTLVFEKAGFHVVSAAYANLWPMLNNGRYMAFNRGLNEAYIEIKQKQPTYPDLVVDDNIMIAYKFDYFFYMNKSNEALFNQFRAGLFKSYKNGAFIKNFENHPMIKTVTAPDRPQRKVFYVNNPNLSPRVNNIPDEYWHKF